MDGLTQINDIFNPGNVFNHNWINLLRAHKYAQRS